MKTKPNHQLVAAFALLFTLILHPSSFGQGALTPPGPPGPTMKTLAQVEPRTPISSVPYTITTSGSYYLTTNLTCTACTNAVSGILINASHVTLDLMGFELVGVPGSGDGVRDSFVSGQTNVVVRNGTIRGWDGSGVNLIGPAGEVTQVRALNNKSTGISLGTGIIAHCLVTSNGFLAGGAGINVGRAEIHDCVADANTVGIQAGGRSLILNNVTSGNRRDGILVGAESLVLNNVATGNGNSVAGSTAGIHATGNGNRIDGNHVFANNGDGILVDSTAVKNFVVRNTVGGQTCSGCFQIRVPGIPGQPPAGANVVGPIVSDATNVNANAWANIQQF
jgi:hypothetical protein